jgi:hypothetical protein
VGSITVGSVCEVGESTATLADVAEPVLDADELLLVRAVVPTNETTLNFMPHRQ